ncbi:hypothetical protein J437_LFUL012496 [Ladona fulva]|uniref:Ig-like domain-containing protein n=1 Tax=Ladona fulva TaxID=123851 RepID=A0A8K0P4Z4_LADFU|nr:hypothetical protein J437_LFUL012496 [Ladona fulva]
MKERANSTVNKENTVDTSPWRFVVAMDGETMSRFILRPLSVRLVSKPRVLQADQEYEVTCEALGSRPRPIFSWFKDGRKLKRTKGKIMFAHARFLPGNGAASLQDIKCCDEGRSLERVSPVNGRGWVYRELTYHDPEKISSDERSIRDHKSSQALPCMGYMETTMALKEAIISTWPDNKVVCLSLCLSSHLPSPLSLYRSKRETSPRRPPFLTAFPCQLTFCARVICYLLQKPSAALSYSRHAYYPPPHFFRLRSSLHSHSLAAVAFNHLLYSESTRVS